MKRPSLWLFDGIMFSDFEDVRTPFTLLPLSPSASERMKKCFCVFAVFLFWQNYNHIALFARAYN